MAKGSGTTKGGNKSNPKGLVSSSPAKITGGGDYKMAYDEAQSAVSIINKMKAPAVGETNRVQLPGGYYATISNLRPGYGKGGFLQSNIYNSNGDKMGGVSDHRERYGSIGMAEFGTKKEALDAVKDAMASWIRIRMMGLKY